jgi:predicted metal-dependent phosphotriesterase family hydrolase
MPVVETVLGLIATSEIGITLPHEHLFINLLRERRGDGLVHDEELIAEEIAVFRAQGGQTIVDLSSHDLTIGASLRSRGATAGHCRSPENVEAIVRLSRTSGLNVVLGTGHYRDPYLDHDYFDTHTVDEIAEEIVRDLTEAIPGTDVRAGVIGEIGSDKWYISAREERSFRAAARASVRTSAGLYTHAARWPVGLAQLDLLAEESVALDRVAVGHVDTVPDPDYSLALARRGVYVGIDTMFDDSPRAIAYRVGLLLRLVRAGFGDRILLSHDVCVPSQLRAGGGPGFGLVHGTFKAMALKAGLDEEQFRSITTDNAARFLAG